MSAIQQAAVTQINTPGNSNYDPYYSNVSLLLSMNGSNGSTSFVDASPNQKTVTATGTAQISTDQSRFGGSSVYFDGSSALSVSGLSSLNQFTASGQIGTIECWIRFTNFNAPRNFIFGSYGTGEQGWTLDVGSSGNTIALSQNTVLNNTLSIPQLSINVWYHFALVNTGSNLVFYLNGVNVGTNSNYSVTSATQDFRIGARRGTELPLSGYIDDFRITQDIARYTSNFTPPTYANPLTGSNYDPFYNNVSLLLHCNGTNASTNFIDNSGSPKTVTANGNAQISTTQWKFNGSSAYFDGTGDYLSIARNNEFLPVANEDFTIETWVYLTATPGAIPVLIAGLGEYGTDSDWNFQINSSLQVSFYINAIVTTFTNTTTPITLNSWNHVAVSRSGTGSNNLRVFVNGIGQSFTTNSTTVGTGNRNLTIGADQNGDEANLTGYIDDFRITKGVGRYTSNFTPPRVPYADSSINIDPYYDQTVLLLPMNGANASTSFIDSSKTAKIVTSAGSAAISTAQNKFGGSSLLIDALTKYLSVPNSTDVDMGSSDFTIECWVYATTWGSGSTIISKRANTGVDSPLIIYLSNGTINARLTNTGATAYTITGSALSTSTWHHIAYTRMGNNTYLYVNGTQVGSTLAVTGSALVNTAVLTIGNEASYAVSPTVSTFYIDDVRITKGVARYTSNFTVPVRPNPTTGIQYDNYYDNVSLLLHMNGPNNGTSFVDSSLRAKTITANGSPVTSTTQYKYGVSSAYFDGSGVNRYHLTVPSSADLTFGTGDFTVECYLYETTAPSYNILTFAGQQWCVYFSAGPQSLRFFDGAADRIIGGVVSLNTWHHIALTREGTTVRLFLNGVLQGTPYTNSPITNLTGGTTYIGYYPNDVSVTGYMDEVRFTQGIARYTANFTPPAQAFPDQGPQTDPFYYNTSLLLHFDGTNASTNFVDNSPVIKSITPSGNAQISTSQWKFNGSSAYFDGTGDLLFVPASNDFNFGTNPWTIECWVRIVADAGGVIDVIIGNRASNFLSGQWYLFYVSSNIVFDFRVGGSDNNTVGATGIAFDTWYHIAVVRNGTNFAMYKDGVLAQASTINISNSIGSTLYNISIGNSTDSSFPLNGYIDDLRITKGVARYLNNFTPPQRPFPNQ